jgi:hypothetical protein
MPRSIVLRRAVKDCRHCRIRIPAPDSKITSLPSSDGRGGRRTEYAVKWKHDAHPPANIVPTIIFLVHIARGDLLFCDWRRLLFTHSGAKDISARLSHIKTTKADSGQSGA